MTLPISARVTPGADGDSILVMKDLSIRYRSGQQAVSGVDLEVKPGETVGLIGESGCGKSSIALAAMNLLPTDAAVSAARFEIMGSDVQEMSEAAWETVRGRDVSIIFQEPMTALNPCMRIGKQIAEVLLLHGLVENKREATERALAALRSVQISKPELRMNQFPYQLSGGMRQRVMIAIAMAASAPLLVADEPTTALDVTVQAEILRLLDDLRREHGLGVLLVSHDLGVVSQVCDRIVVMYAGQIVEEGTPSELLSSPRHPYTAGLVTCIPRSDGVRRSRLTTIPGRIVASDRTTVGCRFQSRCPHARAGCELPQTLSVASGGTRAVRCWVADELDPLLGPRSGGAGR
ncbi:ABC transporter ATP-binding protein [Leekyejoonella antrihumi]|uniref:ABC transporter ATP-binding protein n=1 Tax=Leekyejoonella antrihumi TaxID=1660198 RepID=A0A563E9J0_9MICO|nr:ABC transporter ATP-binding protein [Leekyejoonella antrihumi]TWP38484.1 ABC transporter ATP-binding protein [Leekyejoonella antrihumi]